VNRNFITPFKLEAETFEIGLFVAAGFRISGTSLGSIPISIIQFLQNEDAPDKPGHLYSHSSKLIFDLKSSTLKSQFSCSGGGDSSKLSLIFEAPFTDGI
jgi:hypothetical protein